ncbi:hypothetical protein SMMN14_00599 [Sphaerulina musiva]
MRAVTILEKLSTTPQQHPDCCCSLSLTLLDILIGELLPCQHAPIFSCGAGTGLLEQLIMDRSHGSIDIYGVEVPSCVNKYLSDERMLRVHHDREVHESALRAAVLIFCYPRSLLLVERYLLSLLSTTVVTRTPTLQKLIVLTHRDDYPSLRALLVPFFDQLSIVSNSGLPDFEVLAVATHMKKKEGEKEEEEEEGVVAS